jgi:6-methylsalicylate decarboxylase
MPEDISGRFDLMEATRVGRQVLWPHWPSYLPNETQGVHADECSTTAMLNWCAKYPDRISSYVMLPPPHIDASLMEIARGLDELGCVGVDMNSVCLGDPIGHEKFEPIYAEMNRRGNPRPRRCVYALTSFIGRCPCATRGPTLSASAPSRAPIRRR